MKFTTISYDDYFIKTDYNVCKVFTIVLLNESSLTIIQILYVKFQ